MTASLKRLTRAASPEIAEASQHLTTRAATLVELSARGPLILLSGSSCPVLARTTVPRQALHGREGAELLVTFLDGREDAPVVVGVLEPIEVEAWAPGAEQPSADAVATVDGKRVLIRGAEEILLQCGEASLVLRANGEVLLRGKRVEMRARRQHRIRAGSVRIN
jgi:hypothetical protein